MSEMAESRSAIVERLYDAWNRVVEEGAEVEEIVGLLAEVIDPEAEYINPPEAIERGTRRGVDGMTTVVRNLREAGIQRGELIRVVAQGEKVACVYRLHIVGPGSGVETASPSISQLWTFRGDRIIRMEWWLDPEEAFSRLPSGDP
jgi:hypothetical protein